MPTFIRLYHNNIMYSSQSDLPMTAYCGYSFKILYLNCNWFTSRDLVRTATGNFGFKYKSLFFYFYKVLSTILNYRSSITIVL